MPNDVAVYMSDKVPYLNHDELLEVLQYTKTATAIHVGEDAVIQMANDAMLHIWGKDRSVVGKSLEEALPELKGQPFAQMFRKVWLEGITISGTDTAADLEIDGVVSTFYFDFEYRAIKNENGRVLCVLHSATDVTERVMNNEIREQAARINASLAREQALNEELAAANEELNAINEELSSNQEQLHHLNQELEKKVEERVKALKENEKRYRELSEQLAAMNEEMLSANEELMAANEEIAEGREHLQHAFDEMEDKEIALRLAVEAANFGTWHLHSGTGEFITSARLRELFGYPEDHEVSIAECLAQVREDYRDYVSGKLESAISGNGDYDVSYPVLGLKDQVRWLRAIGNLKLDKSGEFSAFTGVVMDISAIKKEEQRKNDFIAIVSHELKTPLTSLNAHIQLLQRKNRGVGDSFTDGSLDMAGKQVKKMTAMINGFLDVSRLESGTILLKQTDFMLNDLIENAVAEVSMMHTSHTIQYQNKIQVPVRADYEKMGNVISNLLSNAIKYAPMNPNIEVSCEILNDVARVSVKDEGIGVGSKDIRRLFERFYRVETGSHISGFGIGLYLSAEIIEKHHGRIWAESEQGKGATFFFELPLNR
ncbi:ATP-binding protein [Pedobacter sp. GR22-6]|uniref:ATP-binding protein n=1 Tax=Pedobacter sp. GR22-6 TaxID=3127957 RepID=UPI00307F189F